MFLRGIRWKWISPLALAIWLPLAVVYSQPSAAAESSKSDFKKQMSGLVPIKLANGVNHVEFFGTDWECIDDSCAQSKAEPYSEKGLIVVAEEGPLSMIRETLPANLYLALAPGIEPLDAVEIMTNSPPSAPPFTLQDLPDVGGDYVTSVQFFQGMLDQHRQTFLVVAEKLVDRTYKLYSWKDGDPINAPINVRMSVYVFDAVNPDNHGPMPVSPVFQRFGQYVTRGRYGSAQCAISKEFAVPLAAEYLRQKKIYPDLKC